MNLDVESLIHKPRFICSNSHYNEVRDNFLKNVFSQRQSLEESVSKTLNSSDEDRIKIFESCFKWIPIPQIYFERIKKSSEVSIQLRESGNQYYKEKNFPLALRCYNLSLCFAPQNSKELTLAYSNRSALLMAMELYQNALQDIERAEQLPEISSEILSKLNQRRKKCEEMLANNNGQSDVNPERKFVKELSLLPEEKENAFLIGARSFVKMESNEDKGRFLVAAENIPAGTVLLKDKPYLQVSTNLLLWDTKHCSTCCKPIKNGIPDDISTFLMFCSENCKLEIATKDTGMLDKLFCYIHQTSLLHSCLLPILTVLKVFQNDNGNFLEKVSQTQETYDPSSFSSTYNLVQHKLKFDFSSESVPNEFKALFLANLIKELSRGKMEISISPSLILHLIENLPYNIITLSTWPKPEGKSVPYSTALLNLIALANNSCQPSAALLKHPKDDEALLLSVRNIEKGEEISLSYLTHWSRTCFVEREKYFRDSYNFSCSCEACGENELGPNDILETSGLMEKKELAEEDQEKIVLAQDDMEEVVALIGNGEFAEAFTLAAQCCDALSKYDKQFRLCVLAEDLFRMILMEMTMI